MSSLLKIQPSEEKKEKQKKERKKEKRDGKEERKKRREKKKRKKKGEGFATPAGHWKGLISGPELDLLERKKRWGEEGSAGAGRVDGVELWNWKNKGEGGNRRSEYPDKFDHHPVYRSDSLFLRRRPPISFLSNHVTIDYHSTK